MQAERNEKKSTTGQQVASFITLQRAFFFNFMKRPPRPDHPRATARRSQRDCLAQNGSSGRWEFNLATGSLFVLGSTERVRQAAYRTADGQLRFLPRRFFPAG